MCSLYPSKLSLKRDLLAFKVKHSVTLSSQQRTPRLWSLVWSSDSAPLADLYNRYYCLFRVSLLAQTVRNLPAMRDTWARFLDQEDPLEKEMETQLSVLAWRIL